VSDEVKSHQGEIETLSVPCATEVQPHSACGTGTNIRKKPVCSIEPGRLNRIKGKTVYSVL
jgi:hypothetical protein